MARFRPRLRRTNDSPFSSQQSKTARRRSRFRRLFPRLLPFDGFRTSRAVERLVAWFASPAAGGRTYATNLVGRGFGLQFEGLEDRVLLARDVTILDNVGAFNSGVMVVNDGVTVTYTATADDAEIDVDNINNNLNNGLNVVVNVGSTGTQFGDIDVLADILKTMGGNVTLHLDGRNGDANFVDVETDVSIISTAGELNLLFESQLTDSGGGRVSFDNNIINTNGGDVTLRTQDDIFLDNATAIVTGGGHITAHGDFDENGVGPFFMHDSASLQTSGGNVLIVVGDDDAIADAFDLNGTINSGAGNITIEMTDSTSPSAIEIGDGTAGTGDLIVDAAELQRLVSTGTVTIGADGQANAVELGNADLSAETYDLTIFGDNLAGGNDFSLAGNFIGPDGQTMRIVNTGGDVVDNFVSPPPEIEIAGGSLIIEAVDVGIGGNLALEISVAQLDVNATGSVAINNTGALELVDLNGIPGLTAGGLFQISTASPLTVSSPILALGNVNLIANDSAATGDDLTINADVASDTGSVSLIAGDNVIVSASAAVEATAGSIVVRIDDGNADPGVGAMFTSNGATYIVGPTGVLDVAGNLDNDSITLASPVGFSNGGRIFIDGAAGDDSVSVSDVDVTGADLTVSGLAALTIVNATNVNILGMMGNPSEFNSSAAMAGNGILIDNVTNVNMDWVTASGNRLDGIAIDNATGAIVFDHVDASDNIQRGVQLTPGAASFRDTDGTYNHNHDDGLQLGTIAGNVTLVRTEANDNDEAFGGSGEGVDITSVGGNLLIQGGSFSDTDAGATGLQERGIRVGMVTGSVTFEDSTGTVESVVASGNRLEGIHINNVGGNVMLTNVEASLNDAAGMIILGAGSFSDTGGVYTSNAAGGISLRDILGNVTLTNTTAEDNTSVGVEVRDSADAGTSAIGGNLTISGGSFSVSGGAQNYGFVIWDFGDVGGNIVISGGAEFDGNSNLGFGIDTNTSVGGAIDISGSSFNDNGQWGFVTTVGTDAASISFTNSFATGNGSNLGNNGGVVIGSGFTGPFSADGLTADNNAGDGLRIIGPGAATLTVDVTGGSFSGNDDDGIHLTGVDNVTLVNVTAGGNDPGVVVSGAASFSDTGGTYNMNAGDGMLLSNIVGAVTLDGTEASGNGSSGIDMDTVGAVTATDVTADDNGLDGLQVETAPSVAVVGGSYSGNNDGIDADVIAGIIDVSGATIEDNAARGVQTNGEDLILDGNTFDGNDVDVEAAGGTARVQNNVFGGTSRIGVLIQNGAVVDLGQGTDPEAPNVDYTGLGISVGLNDFTAYTAAATAATGAIVVENLEPAVGATGSYPTDIAAFDNLFTGDPEVVIWHDVDNNALAFVNSGDIGSLTIEDVSVNEDTGVATITVTFNSPIMLTPFTTEVSLADGTASAGAGDYTNNSPFLLMFTGTPGQTHTIDIPIGVDDVVEFDETIDVSLMSTTHSAVDESDTATVTIVNDDFATITILNNVSELEGSGGGTTPFVYMIELSNPVQGDLLVDFIVADFTTDEAVLGFNGDDDYDAPPSPFDFGTDPAAGTSDLTILVRADDVVEGDEEFILNLDDFAMGTTANTAAITIDTTPRFGDVVNDDQTSVTITDETVTEGTSAMGFTTMTFDVASTQAVQGGFFQPFTLNHLTTEAGDLPPGDLVLVTSSPLTFTGNAGEVQTITVNIRQDALVEFDETFEIVLGVPIVPPGTGVDPDDIVVTDGTGLGTIVDDDSATVTINNVNLAEETGGTTPFNFTLTLSGGTVEDAFTVEVDTAEFLNEATSGVDFTALVDHLVTFPAGSVAGATQTVTVNVTADNITEDDEQFDVVLTDPFTMADEPDINVSNVAGIGTIVNDDIAKISIIPPNPAAITEGDAPATPDAVFTVQLSNPIEVPITVSFARNDVDTSALDFTVGGANTTSPIIIPAQATSGTITVEILSDGNIEADEDFEVELTGHVVPAPAGINPAHVMIDAMADTATATITNDDTATIRVLDAATMTSSNISMTETTTTYMFVVKYEGDPIPTGADVDVDTANDTAVAPGDYTTTSASFTFTGNGTMAFNVPVHEDAIVEANEVFDVVLSNLMSVNNAAITLVDGTGTILDDEDALTVEFSSAATASTEGAAIPAGQQPTLVVKGQSEIPVGVQVVQTGGDASSADHNLPQTVTIPPNTYDGLSGGSFFPVGLTVVNDSLVENTETIVMGTSPNADVTVGDANMNAQAQSSHTHTITDNDVYTVTAQVNGQQAVTINEGGKVTLTGTIFNTAQDHVITVQWGDGASDMLTVDDSQFSGGQANYMLMHVYLDDVPTVSPTDTYSLVISVTSASGQQQIVGPAPQVTVNNVAPIFTSLNVNPTSGNVGQQVTVSGTYSDPGILDTFQFLIDTNNDGVFDITTPVANGVIPSQVFTVNQATSAFRFRITDDDSGLATQIVPVNFQAPAPPPVTVQDSRVFLNASAFDGNNGAVNAADVNAIDTSKSSATIGQPTTFANITGSDDGITGVTFVVSALPNDGAGLTAADFVVRRGTTNNINGWVAGPAPTGLLVLPNSVGGADRVLLTFAANSIQDTYASFQMLANANTGLVSTHTAVFGNVRGDTGAAFVGVGSFFGRDAADLQAMVPALFQPAGVTSPTDINEDGTTNAFDLQVIPVVSTAAVGGAFQSNVLPVITPGFAAVPAPGFASAAADEAMADDVDEAASFVPNGNGPVAASQDGRVGGTDVSGEEDRDLAFATFASDADADSDLIGDLAADRLGL